ncbi:MAG TPA: helicase-related protein, partial [Pirellulaceae bacterium]|nr:helicase-related protein [Pirellulaceae bacterium]
MLGTVNDYLAKRDAEWMGPIYRELGVQVGLIQTDQPRPSRREAYESEVTYGTMKEYGFDFLRDRVLERDRQNQQMWYGHAAVTGVDFRPVQREPYFFLIDEADSVLIDEARTPLIISAPQDEQYHQRLSALYRWAAEVAPLFVEDTHYLYDREKRKVDLSTIGTAMLRELHKPDELTGFGLVQMYEFVERAIQVYRDYHLDREYVVRDGEVLIVDEATGRISHGRRWSRGIHQAIEAKERLDVTPETRSQAKITVQAFVNRFPIVAGMTGTAATSRREFAKVYRIKVAVVPPNRPLQQHVYSPVVTRTAADKWLAIAEEIDQLRQAGRAILVGTRSIAKSEHLSQLLHQKRIEHVVLNANQIEREAEIVSLAGRAQRVTVATNMAGRGTDIQIEPSVREAGGLHVICSEMHDSSRIDWQLFGRCARQGDPGSVRQFISHEDELIDLAYGVRRASRFRKVGATRPAEWWVRLFRNAQRKVERRHFRARRLLMYNEKNLIKTQREMGLDPILDHLAE